MCFYIKCLYGIMITEHNEICQQVGIYQEVNFKVVYYLFYFLIYLNVMFILTIRHLPE